MPLALGHVVRRPHTSYSDANKQLTAVIQTVIDALAKAGAPLTPAQASEIEVASNGILIVIGAVDPSSVIPPGETALFDVYSVLDGFGTSKPVTNLLTSTGNAGDQLITGSVQDACTTLAGMITMANGHLTQAQIDVFVPAVNDVQQALSC